jgi:hypothetical protein
MGPKVEAALRFLAGGGELAVITSAGLLAASLSGTGTGTGTRIERDPAGPASPAGPAGPAHPTGPAGRWPRG